jgi:hypothetical protein
MAGLCRQAIVKKPGLRPGFFTAMRLAMIPVGVHVGIVACSIMPGAWT